MIPKVIHQTIKDISLLSNFSMYDETLRLLHPNWKINIYTDIEALKIVEQHFPQWLDIYNSFNHNIQRADIFRLMVLYLYGGFYSDLDILPLKKYDPLCNNQVIIGVEKTLTNLEMEKLGHRHNLRIANYMFASIAKHPFWLSVLNSAMNILATRIINSEKDILESTGPGLVTNVYHEVRDLYPEITVLPNNTNYCVKRCTRTPSCHFGDYAIHYHLGSWRWQSVKK